MPEGLFYAYADSTNQTYLLTFVSQGSCDRWWRALQGQEHDKETLALEGPWDIRRLSPQFYSIPDRAWQFHRQNLSPIEKGLSIMHTRINKSSGYNWIPPPSRTDYLNGKAYYVRSRAQPSYFWNVKSAPERRVSLSNPLGLTKFIIQRANPLPYDYKPQEDVLLGRDEVIMIAVLDGKQEALTVNENFLQSDSYVPVLKFKFGLLTSEGGFAVTPETTDIRFRADGLGDVWELVN